MFKVALCSFLFQGNRLKDLESMRHGVRNAARQHCNLVCFPECALSGLSADDYKKDVKLAVKILGKVTQKIGILARTHRIYVAIGLLEQTGNGIGGRGVKSLQADREFFERWSIVGYFAQV